MLYEKGANINAFDFEDNTPMHIAAFHDSYESAECLLKMGPNLFLRNKEGKFAVDIVKSSKMIRLFNNAVKLGHEPRQSPRVLQIPRFIEQSKEAHVLHSTTKCVNSPFKEVIPKNKGKDKFSNLKIIGLIGKGSFGEVHLIQHRITKKYYAMKSLLKTKVFNQHLIKYAFTEKNVMSTIRHSFIVPVRMAFQSSDKLYMVMDYCPGGDLGHVLKREKKLSEDRAKIYICEILSALEHLHRNDIIYRDLKPDNVVLDQNGHAMLTDFGLSKEGMDDYTTAQSFCGSVAYLAPEMLLRKGHSKAVDWYLLGVLLYEMVVGMPPFYDKSRNKLFENILSQGVVLPTYISDSTRSLITQLMEKDPEKRLGGELDADEIKLHPYFEGVDWGLVVSRKLMPPKPYIEKIAMENRVSKSGIDVNGVANKVENWSFIDNDEGI